MLDYFEGGLLVKVDTLSFLGVFTQLSKVSHDKIWNYDI